jgi:hypothetical protein
VSFYRRRLPHWQIEGVPIFLTWRLHGSLPAGRRNVEFEALTDGQRFLLHDRQLDLASSGPVFLKVPDVAAAVVETFFLAGEEWGLYKLFSWVVMSNHFMFSCNHISH